MIKQKSYIRKVIDCFNKKRANIKGSDDDIQALDNEYTLIHSKFDNFMDNQVIPIEDNNENLNDYLKGIARSENSKFESPLLIRMVNEVCVEMNIIESSSVKKHSPK